VDYSNDTLSITRNPFGFINTKKPGKAPANKAPANKAPKPVQDVPRTIIRRGGHSEMTGGGSDSDTDSDSDSDSDEEEKQEHPQKKRVSKKQKSSHKPKRRTKRKVAVIKQLVK
jgi:hypothetical protein